MLLEIAANNWPPVSGGLFLVVSASLSLISVSGAAREARFVQRARADLTGLEPSHRSRLSASLSPTLSVVNPGVCSVGRTRVDAAAV